VEWRRAKQLPPGRPQAAGSIFSGSAIISSGMDAARRIAARLYARSLGIEMQRLPKPVDLAALRIPSSISARPRPGLPVIHAWGGVAAESVAEKHRS